MVPGWCQGSARVCAHQLEESVELFEPVGEAVEGGPGVNRVKLGLGVEVDPPDDQSRDGRRLLWGDVEISTYQLGSVAGFKQPNQRPAN